MILSLAWFPCDCKMSKSWQCHGVQMACDLRSYRLAFEHLGKHVDAFAAYLQVVVASESPVAPIALRRGAIDALNCNAKERWMG